MTVECGALQVDGKIVYTLPYYPVGRIIETTSKDDDPNKLYKGQKWEYFGAGKVMVGYDPNDTDFNMVEKIGGEKEHTLTIDEMPSHNHDNGQRMMVWDAQQTPANTGGSPGPIQYYQYGQWSKSNGGDKPHNNLQPYIVVYRWRRIS